MRNKNPYYGIPGYLLVPVFLVIIFNSCTEKIYQHNKPYIYKNNPIEVKGGKFTREELISLKQRLEGQLSDSSEPITSRKKGIISRKTIYYPAYDTAASAVSARSMITSMQFIGYFNSHVTYDTTSKGPDKQRVVVTYTVDAGQPTRIDTVSYRLRLDDLQHIATRAPDSSFLKVGNPITKQDVLGEKTRLINLYRNSGYQKFTADELRVKGDTTIAALTNIDLDPFSPEYLQLLADAQNQKDSPTIKLSVDLNPPKPAQSNRLTKYYIRNVYIMPDFRPYDSMSNPSLKKDIYVSRRDSSRVVNILYHDYLFKNNFLARNMYLRSGELYSQDNFYRTINSFTKKGVWQSVNMQALDVKNPADSNKLDLLVQLIPGKMNTLEGNVEMSLSSSNINNITSSNLIGLSTNIGLTTRNIGKEAIQMSNKLGVGVEFSSNKASGRSNIINSNDINFSNNIIMPRISAFYGWFDSLAVPKKFRKKNNYINRQTFTNASVSYVNRINLFDLQTANLGAGATVAFNKTKGKANGTIQQSIKLPNIEFTHLYHQTDSFNHILDLNPFLKYSFRTALVTSIIYNYQYDFITSTHPRTSKTRKANIEIPIPGVSYLKNALSANNIFKKYLGTFTRIDFESIWRTKLAKINNALFVKRVFLGIGVPGLDIFPFPHVLKSDTALPFFKQYFGGGSGSMRGWPIRGIGRGSQPLKPYSNNAGFNDRTGDIQLEGNVEFRYNIANIIPNSIVLKGSVFADAGNVWNFKNSKPGGGLDSAQFKLKNLYKELGVDAGAGIGIDFTYFLIRFDIGLRFKKPDVAENAGWQFPNANLKNLFGRAGKEWRYENMNFTIGIGYPF